MLAIVLNNCQEGRLNFYIGEGVSMYHGRNTRALRTIDELGDALLALMEERPYYQITVMEICKRANLSRQTFYNYFNDKDEILHLRLRKVAQAEFSRLRGHERITMLDAVDTFERVLRENTRLLDLMVHNGLEGIINEELCDCVTLFTSRFVVTRDPHMLPYSIAFLGGALSQIIVYWFKAENPVTAPQLAHMLEGILAGHYFDAAE